jgi:RNA polymerase sigma factor FliA
MQPLKKPAPIRNEPTSGAGSLDESGVHTIPHGAREAIAAAKAKLSLQQPKAEEAPEPNRRPVRASTHDVCPKMLEAHLTLVHQVVAPIARRVPASVLRDDLLAAGIFGLVDSLRKNGGDGGATFEWYARTRIRGAVLDELRTQDWLTRRARDAVNASAQREDGEAEPVTFVGLDELTILDEQEFLASPELDPMATYEAKETIQLLVSALDKLPERERKIVGMHYFEEAKFKDIGAELGISETRVWQLHARAIERLKSLFIEKPARRPMLRDVCRNIVEPNASQDGWPDACPVNDPPSEVA